MPDADDATVVLDSDAPPPAPDPAPDPPPDDTGEKKPTDYFDGDGLFTGDWKTLIPEDLRGLKVYDSFSDLPGLLKHVGHQDRLIGRQGKGVMPPGDDALPSEVDAFYKAIGRPDKPDEYTFEVPEEVAAFYDEATLTDAKKAFHKAGLTPKQAKILVDLDVDRVKQREAHLVEQAKTDRETAEAALREAWGASYDERLALANRMIADNVAEDKRDPLLKAIGNDPHVAEFLATIATKFMEDGVIDGTRPEIPTPAEAQGKMDELIAEQARDPNMRNTNPAKYDRMNREIRRLAEQVEAAHAAQARAKRQGQA